MRLCVPAFVRMEKTALLISQGVGRNTNYSSALAPSPPETTVTCRFLLHLTIR
jgi:hypothetical protein